MKNYAYPAVFIRDKENDSYQVLFPDLGLTTDGDFMEEAFLYAKAALKEYFLYIEKFDLDFNLPSDYELVKSSCKPGEIVMIIDAQISQKDLK